MGGGLVLGISSTGWGLAKDLCGQKSVVFIRLAKVSHKTLYSGGESGIRTEYLTHLIYFSYGLFYGGKPVILRTLYIR